MIRPTAPSFVRQPLAMILVAAATMVGGQVRAGTMGSDATLRSNLERVASERIFFGHQSVGGNVLEGIARLASSVGTPLVLIDGSTSRGAVGSGFFRHAFLAENGKPFQKLQAFEIALSAPGGVPDIALMKFCYLDFTPDTDPKLLFARYRAMVETLHLQHPGLTIVHVTAPLTTVQSGYKALVKSWMGKAPYGAIENQRRDDYNALLRQAYSGHEPIFDLARIESTTPEGSIITTEWKGRKTPSLSPAHTEDGGHLNATGQLRAARELVSVLAAISAKP